MEGCEELQRRVEAADANLFDAQRAWEPVQAEEKQYSTADELAAREEAKEALEEWKTFVPQEDQGELIELAAERDELEGRVREFRAQLRVLFREESDINDELTHLDHHITDLEDAIKALEGTWDPETESSPAYEDAKAALDELLIEYDKRVTRLDEIADEVGGIQNDIDNALARIEAITRDLPMIADDIEGDVSAQVPRAQQAYDDAVAAHLLAIDEMEAAGWLPGGEKERNARKLEDAAADAFDAWMAALVELHNRCSAQWEADFGSREEDLPDTFWQALEKADATE